MSGFQSKVPLKYQCGDEGTTESLHEVLTHCYIYTEFNVISPQNNNQTPKTIRCVCLYWDHLTTSENT